MLLTIAAFLWHFLCWASVVAGLLVLERVQWQLLAEGQWRATRVLLAAALLGWGIGGLHMMMR